MQSVTARNDWQRVGVVVAAAGSLPTPIRAEWTRTAGIGFRQAE